MIAFMDLFGQPFRLNYNGENLFKSSVSAIFSILFVITVMAYSFYNLYLMFQHKGLIINYFQTNMPENANYTFNNNNFLAFQLLSKNNDNIFDSKSNNLSKYFTFNASKLYNIYTVDNLRISKCDLKIYEKLPQDNGLLLCIDFNNTKMDGNYFSTDAGSYINILLDFNYTLFFQDNTNNSINITNFFPLRLYVFYQVSNIDLLNYDQPFSNSSGLFIFDVLFNVTINIEISTQLIEINTDSSYISNSLDTLKLFTSNYIYHTNDLNFPTTILINFYYYLNPIKSVYYREYMKLVNVMNNVSSLAHIIFSIFGLLCSRYNQYKLKVDFIEENILFKLEKQKTNDNNELILNPENPIMTNPSNNLQPFQDPKRPCQFIKMKSYFDYLFCCKSEYKIRKVRFSDDASDFYEKLIDAKRILLLLTQFDDLKNVWLESYQTVILNYSKIILDPEEIKKIENDEKKYQKCFHEILIKRSDKVNKMLLNKFY